MNLMTLGMLIVFIGFVMIFAGMLCMFYHAWEQATAGDEHDEHDVRGGGIVMIGPFPIIFGTDTASVKILMVLAAVLMLLAFLIILLGIRI